MLTTHKSIMCVHFLHALLALLSFQLHFTRVYVMQCCTERVGVTTQIYDYFRYHRGKNMLKERRTRWMNKQYCCCTVLHSLLTQMHTTTFNWSPQNEKRIGIAFLFHFPYSAPALPHQIYGHITNVDYFVAELLLLLKMMRFPLSHSSIHILTVHAQCA